MAKEIEIEKLMKRVDAKQMIQALRLVGTPFVDIVFDKNSDEIMVKHPRSGVYSILYAKN